MKFFILLSHLYNKAHFEEQWEDYEITLKACVSGQSTLMGWYVAVISAGTKFRNLSTDSRKINSFSTLDFHLNLIYLLVCPIL